MKIRFAFFLGFIAFCSASATVSAISLYDVTDIPERDAITGLVDRGIVEGYKNGTFQPENPINRAEFMKILIGSRFPHHIAADVRCFTDLEVKTPQWYANSVCSARELGIVGGYPDGSFQPNNNVNLAEGLKMAFRSFGIIPSVSVSEEWYQPYLTEARNRGILIGLLKNPSHILTRAEMATLTFALVIELENIDEHMGNTTTPVCGNAVVETPEQCDDGNTEDSDGCSSICLLVSEPVRRAFLEINQQAAGAVSSIAQGQRHLTMMKFTVTAARQDALLTSLTFTPSVGSLLYAKNYTLAMDRDGTGQYASIVANGRTDGSRLIFDELLQNGVRIPKDLNIPFRITADLASTLGPVTLGLQFATEDPEYVQVQGFTDNLALTGIETDNTCTASDCFIRVNTRASSDINIVSRGNLWVTEDNIPVTSHILLAGNITPALLRLRMRSDGETIDVRQLRFDGVTSSVDSLLLYQLSPGQSFDPNTLQPFAQASPGQCINQLATRMCTVLSLRTFIVNPLQDTVLIVAARMKNEQLGAVGGELLTLTLSAATDATGHALEASGISSTQALDQNNGDASATGEIFIGRSTAAANSQILGRTNDTALANIASIVNGGATAISSIPTGNTAIGSFKIQAFPHTNTFHGSHDVIIKTLNFQVSAQNVQIDPASFRLAVSDNPSLTLACAATDTTGLIVVSCTNIDQSVIQSHIGQGQFVTYQLYANVTNPQIAAGVSSLLTELPILGSRSQTNSVIWSDGVTTFSWVDVAVTSVSSTMYR